MSDKKYSKDELLRETLQWRISLTAYAYSLLRDWSLAEDAFQEALIVVSNKWESYIPGNTVLPWVRQIVRYQAKNLQRKQQRYVVFADESLMDLIDQRFGEYENEYGLDELEKRKTALQSCMKKLDQKARELLMGFYHDAMSCDELSQTVNLSANAVRIRLSRIRSRLRLCVQKRLQGTVAS